MVSDSDKEAKVEAVVGSSAKANGAEDCENGCEGDDAVATHRCRECHMAICDFCVAAHRRRPHTKSHVLTRIEIAIDAAENHAQPVGSSAAGVTDAPENAGGSQDALTPVAPVVIHHVVPDEDEDEEDEEEDDGNNDYCEICKGESGELVCCDFCPSAYHGRKCLNAKAEDLPDPYKCPKCTGELAKFKAEYIKRKRDKKRGLKPAGGASSLAGSKGKAKKIFVQGSEDEMQEADEDEDGEDESDDDPAVSSDDDEDDEDSSGGRLEKKASVGRMRLTRVRFPRENGGRGGDVFVWVSARARARTCECASVCVNVCARACM